MANKNYRGIFLDPISDGVKKELNRRSKNQAARSSEAFSEDDTATFKEESQKLSWCKLLSNAKSELITDPVRYSNQLYMGRLSTKSDTSEVFIEDFSRGFGTDTSFQNPFDYDLGKNSQNRPRPGIDKVSIINKGSLGSIRVATIDYFVHTEADLKLMEQLYMVPGITCLLEWGWSNYSGNTIQDTDLKSMEDVQLQILKKSLDMNDFGDQDVSNNAGRYDAMLGVITKFNWDVQADGSYSCQTTIMSPNGLIGELPTKTSNYSMQGKDILWTTGGPKDEDKDRQVYMYTDIEGILQYFKQLGQIPEVYGKNAVTTPTHNIFKVFLGYDEFFKTAPIQNIPWRYATGDFNGEIYSNLFQVKHEFYDIVQDTPSKILAMTDPKERDKAIEKIGSLGNEVGWDGRIYGFNTYFPRMDAAEVYPVSFVSWRFIEDVLLAGLRVTKKYDDKDLLKIRSVHEHEQEGLVRSNKIRNNRYIRSLDHKVCFLPGQCGIEGITLWNKELPQGNKRKLVDINEDNSKFLPPIPYPSNDAAFGRARIGASAAKDVNFYRDLKRFRDQVIQGKGYLPRPPRDITVYSKIIGDADEIDENIGYKLILGRIKDAGTKKSTEFTPADAPKNRTRERHEVYLDPFSPGIHSVAAEEWKSEYDEGYLRNIMLNVDFIIETYNSTDNIKDFIKSLLDGVNEACGSPWDFQIQANQNTPNILSIVDTNWSKKIGFKDNKTINPDDVFVFKPNTHSSIIKSVKLTSKLPNKVQAAAFIGASRNAQQGQKDGTGAWTAYSQGITDRYSGTTEIKPAASPADKAFTEKVLTPLETFLVKNYDYNLSIYTDEEASNEAKTHLNQYINDYPDIDIGQGKPTRPLIPLDLSLDLDGISGIYLGNAITVSPVKDGGILPDRYQNKTVFQVTNVTHTLSGFDWETSIEGMMRMVGFEDDHNIDEENNEITKGPEGSEEEEEEEPVTEEDIIAATLVHEAASHGTLGMAAVMLVIKNRTSAASFPNSFENVILQKRAFEPWNGVTIGEGGKGNTKFKVVENAKKYSTDFKHAKQIYKLVIAGKIPQGIVGTALNFVNPDIVERRRQAGKNVPQWPIDLMDPTNADKRRIIYDHVFTNMISETPATFSLPMKFTEGAAFFGGLTPNWKNKGPRKAWDDSLGDAYVHRSIKDWEDKLKALMPKAYRLPTGNSRPKLNSGYWGEAMGL